MLALIKVILNNNIFKNPIFKNNQTKRARDVAQVVECLPNKHKFKSQYHQKKKKRI
jgi:hypothetical protein